MRADGKLDGIEGRPMTTQARFHGCSASWEELQPVENAPQARYCSRCQEMVHSVSTLDEAQALGAGGLCVSMAFQEPQFIGFVPAPRLTDAPVLPFNARIQFLVASDREKRKPQVETLAQWFAAEPWCGQMTATLGTHVRYHSPRFMFESFDAIREGLRKHGIAVRLHPPEEAPR